MLTMLVSILLKNCFGVLSEPLIYLFQLCLEKGVFPDHFKIAKVTPIYKAGDSSNIRNYRTISVLPCFCKILERLMYNRCYKYLKENNICEKQFGFQSQWFFWKRAVHSRSLYWFVNSIWYSWSFHLTEKIETLWHNCEKSSMVWKLFIQQKAVRSYRWKKQNRS